MSSNSISKREFAGLCRVSKGRVSQWIKEGKLSGRAFDGEGPRARIVVEEALRQLKLRLDTGQRFGNGLRTNLQAPTRPGERTQERPRTGPTAEAQEPISPGQIGVEDLAQQIQAEKLAELQLRNRRLREEEFARRGIYTATGDVRSALRKVAGQTLSLVEAAIPEIASGLVRRFGIAQRDAVHTLRTEIGRVRTNIAAVAEAAAKGRSLTVGTCVPVQPDIEQLRVVAERPNRGPEKSKSQNEALIAHPVGHSQSTSNGGSPNADEAAPTQRPTVGL